MLDGLLQMRHQHEVTSLEPVVMQGMMIDVAQHGPRTQTIRLILGVHVLAQTFHHVHTCLRVSRQLTLNNNATSLFINSYLFIHINFILSFYF